MSKKLIDTNPHLRNPKKFKKALLINVLSSTAIEIGKIPPSMRRKLRKRKLGDYSLLKMGPTTLFD